MEDIREVARAYYNGGDDEERKLARKLFKSLDEDGDGKVTLDEYKKRVNPFFSNDHIFRQLDGNGDGTLDFDEVMALYYMDKVSIPRCGACHDLLLGSYFCCLSCLQGKTSYCLCCRCYGGGRFQHRHSSGEFSDTRAMLKLLSRLMAGNVAGDEGCRDVPEGSISNFINRRASKELLRNIVHENNGIEESSSSLAQSVAGSITTTIVETFEDIDLACSIM